MNKKIILASASPRRRELLTQIGLEFTIVVSDTEEKITSTQPEQVVEELSAQKAEAVWEKITAEDASENQEEILVLGADTVVACEGRILGKPQGTEGAKEMPRLLQGRDHAVYTGVTFLYTNADGTRAQHTFHEMTKVHFYPMSEEEIDAYVASGDPLDKAGAYGIQGACARYIRGIEGDYNNVVGLPAGRVYQELHALGIL